MDQSVTWALNPNSVINKLKSLPDYVVYHELGITTESYMEVVTAVKPEWLVEWAPMLFSFKKSDGNSETQNQTKEESMENM